MSALIGALRVVLGMDSAAFEKGASAVEKRAAKMSRSIEKQGQAMTALGQTLSIAVTAPLVAFGYKSVQAAMESRDAMAQVEASLASMGNAAGRTGEQLQAAAGGLMRQSLYDDDEILRKVTATMLTFGAVIGDTFDRAQRDAVDLAAKFGMDLQSATMMLGKALQDPVKGIAALGRAGVSFSASQKKMIKDLVAGGHAAEAQKIILSELERQVKGSAQAARAANPMAALKNSFDDFMENVGGKLLDVLPNITAAIEKVFDAFSALSPGMQQAVVIGGMLAAALGPVLTVIGAMTTAMAPFLGALSVAFAEGGILLTAKAAIIGLGAAFGPILAAVAAFAAAGYLVYQNWDKIAPVLESVWEALSTALGPPLQELLAAVTTALEELWNGPLGESVRTVIGLLGDLVVWQAKALGPGFIAILKSALAAVTNVIGLIADQIRFFTALLSGDWGGAWEAAKSAASHALAAVDAIFMGLPGKAIGYMRDLALGVGMWLRDKLDQVWNWVIGKIGQVKDAFFHLYDAVVGHSYIPDMVDGIAAQMLRLDSVMVDKAEKATKKTRDAFKALAQEAGPLLDRLFPEARALNAFHSDKALIGKLQKAGVLTSGMAGEAMHRLIMEGRPDVTAPVGLAGPLVVDMDKIQEGLARFKDGTIEKARGVKDATVRIAKSFKDMADDTLSALDRMVGAIKGGGFLDILSSVIGLGLQLGSIGAFGKKIQTNLNASVGHNANGTRNWRGGLTWVGERGPELVNLPRGSQVWPSGTGPGGGSVNYFQGNLMTPEFWQMIRAGDLQAAQAGGNLGYAKVARAGRRRL